MTAEPWCPIPPDDLYGWLGEEGSPQPPRSRELTAGDSSSPSTPVNPDSPAGVLAQGLRGKIDPGSASPLADSGEPQEGNQS